MQRDASASEQSKESARVRESFGTKVQWLSEMRAGTLNIPNAFPLILNKICEIFARRRESANGQKREE